MGLLIASFVVTVTACGSQDSVGNIPGEPDTTLDVHDDATAEDTSLPEVDVPSDDVSIDTVLEDTHVEDVPTEPDVSVEDAVESDVEFDIELPDPEEIPVDIVAVQTRLSVPAGSSVAAGTEVSAFCDFISADGDVVIPDASIRPGFTYTPSGSYERAGLTSFIPTRVGELQATCFATQLGLIDAEGVRIEIVPGRAATIVAALDRDRITAGETVAVTCSSFDAYGNAVEGVEHEVRTNPFGAGIEVDAEDGDTVTATAVGIYDISCAVDGAEEIPATLAVEPGLPVALTIGLSPSRELFGVGEVARLVWVVTDAFDNEIDDAPATFSADPAVPSFGEGRFRFDNEGEFALTVTIPPPTESGEALSASLSVTVNSEGPDILCESPFDGEMLSRTEGQSVTVYVRATDASGVSSVTINGEPALRDSAEPSRFSASISSTYGINFVEVEATDGFGEVNSTVCAFLASSRYVMQGTQLAGTIGLRLNQAAIDDGDRTGPLNSLGDLLVTVLNSPGLVSTLDDAVASANPIVPNTCFADTPFGCAFRATINYVPGTLVINGPNDATLTLIDDGLRLQLTVRGLRLGVAVTGTCNTSGTATVNTITGDISFLISLGPDGRPSATLLPLGANAVTVSNVSTSLSGFCGAAINTGIALFQGTVRDLLRDTLRDYLGDNFNEVLDGLVSGLDVSGLGSVIEVPRLDSDEVIPVSFGVGFTGIRISPSRALFALGSTFTAPIAIGTSTRGVPYPPGVVLLDAASPQSASASIHLGLLNQVLHALWRGGLFEATLDDAVLGGSLPEGAVASISLGLPPVARGQAGDDIELQLGALRLDLTYPGIFDSPLRVRLGANARATITLVGDNEISFGDIRIVELFFAVEDVSLDTETRRVLEDLLIALLSGIVDDALNDALPALPIPAFDLPDDFVEFGLPPGASLGIVSPALRSTISHIIIDGDFGVQ